MGQSNSHDSKARISKFVKNQGDVALMEKMLTEKTISDINIRDKSRSNCTALMYQASHLGSVASVEFLLKHIPPALPNIQDDYGYTALHHCLLHKDDAEKCSLLLKFGANPLIQSKKGENSLQFAKQYRRDECKKVLDNYFVLKNISIFVQNEGRTLLLEKFLRDGTISDTNVLDSAFNCSTALMYQALRGTIEAMEFLLTYKPCPAEVNIANSTGQTALHHSVIGGDWPNKIKLLLDYGADRSIPDHDGYSALDLAMKYKRKSCIGVLESYATVCDSQANVFRFVQNRKGNISLLKKMLDEGAISDINIQDSKDGGSTALMYQVHYGSVEAMEFLLKYKPPALPNIRSSNGATALHCCIVSGDHPKKVQLLLDCGADLALKNNAGDSALDIARRELRIESIKVLESYYFKICDCDENKRRFIRGHHGDISLMKRMLDERAISDINIRESGTNETALMYQAAEGTIEAMEFLLKSKPPALVYLKNSKGLTALHLAIQHKDQPAKVRLLLEHGGDMPTPTFRAEILAWAKGIKMPGRRLSIKAIESYVPKTVPVKVPTKTAALDKHKKKLISCTIGPSKPILRHQLEDEEENERKTEIVLQHFMENNPYSRQGVTFTGLLTKTRTGQALVFRGTFRGSPVAIKMFFSVSPVDFIQEVNIMRAIPKHPNVLELIDALDDNNGRRSVILPMMSCSLETLYDSRGIIAPVVLKQYISQIAAGIAHMHESGIAHLDIKCANVLMTSSNVCKICDFGMASQFSGRAAAVFKGTHPFMAPEVWSESRDCDLTKIDVFALGMVIWELLAAQHPWSRFWDGSDIEKWILYIKVKVLANVRPDLDIRWDSSLLNLMVRCWDHEPSRRPSAADIILSWA